MCPPLAAFAALIFLWIELPKALTVRIGIIFHSSINTFLSCARVAGGFRRFLTLLSSSSHMCSFGVKSRLYGGYASGAMLLFARKSWQTRATCGRALSCCRIRLRCCTSGTATGRKILSLYLTAVILPRLFPMRQWRRVLFTDESRFTLYRADGRRRVYRRRGERFADACVVERDRFGGGSVMVWGGIAHGIKSQLIIVAGNMTAVRYRYCSIHVPFCNHNKIFNKRFQTLMKFRNKIYPAFLFPFSIDCGSNECPQSMFWAEIWEISEFFIWKISFMVIKFSVYLNRHVFVMICWENMELHLT